MRPQQFLELAENLAEGGRPEDHRTAISRAYYAVYNVAELFLERMSFPRPRKEAHVTLQRRLMASGDAEIEQVGSDLGDFHLERINADYRMGERGPESQANARAAVLKARSMIAVFETCAINGERWRAIQAGIARANVTGSDSQAPLLTAAAAAPALAPPPG